MERIFATQPRHFTKIIELAMNPIPPYYMELIKYGFICKNRPAANAPITLRMTFTGTDADSEWKERTNPI